MPTLTPASEDTRVYECCILYPYPLDQKEESRLIKEVEGLFEEAGGKLVLKDAWGRRGIAYPIHGSTEGTYVVYYYELDPSKVKEIDRQLRIMKNVRRHMIVKPPEDAQLVKYGELYEQWLKERETIEQRRVREQEEKVQERIAEKAKRQVKRAEKKPDSAPKPAMTEEVLTEQIEKLISDDNLNI